MSSAIVLDTNVIVALLDQGDSLHARAVELVSKVKAARLESELLDVLLFEAISVLTRRATERKRSPPELQRLLGTVRSFFDSGAVRWVTEELGPRWHEVLAIVEDSSGSLNANDAFVVALQRAGVIGAVATFDEKLAAHPGVRRYQPRA